MDLITDYEQRLKEIGELVRGSADDAVDKVKKLLSARKNWNEKSTSCAANWKRTSIPELLAKKQSPSTVPIF